MKKALMAGAALSLMMTGSAWADITIAVAGPMTGQYASFGEQMKAGAEQAVALVRQHGIRYALLKARSPSCGNVENYDGSFSGVRVSGEGVTAAALRQVGVRVFNEEQVAELAALL